MTGVVRALLVVAAVACLAGCAASSDRARGPYLSISGGANAL